MLKRTLVAVVAVGLMAPVGLAEITLNFDPTVVDPGQTVDIAISLTSNHGMDLSVGGIGYEYDTASDAWGVLNPSAFEWIPEDMLNPDFWFISEDLPNPQAVAFFPAAAIDIPDGVSVHFANLTVTPSNSPGEYSLASGASVFDADVNPLELKGGDPVTITVTPEPASLCLLALGGLALLRRR